MLTCIRIFYLLPLLYSSLSLRAQYENKYIDQIEPSEKVIKSWYHYIITNNNKGEYISRTFYPETKQITSYTTFSTEELSIKQGPYKSWYDNGQVEYIGQYSNNKREGFWIEYDWYKKDDLARKHFSGNYVDDLKQGNWKSYLDSKVVDEVFYKNGVKDGIFINYDSTGNIVNKGIYQDNKIISQSKSMSENQFNKETSPEFLQGGYNGLISYLYKNLNYPKEAKTLGISGRAIVKFVVQKDGTIGNIEVIRGLTDCIKAELIRLIESLPDWEPGKVNGKSVNVPFELPIKFILQ